MAAERAGKQQFGRLRRIALDIAAARSAGDSATDRLKVREFHFALYAIADQPTLLRVIEGLWLQTGPYMNLLYPEFVSLPRGPETRARIIRALQSHDAIVGRSEPRTSRLQRVGKLRTMSGMLFPMSPIWRTIRETSPPLRRWLPRGDVVARKRQCR